MPTTIVAKHSNTASAVPTTADIAEGEIAINTVDLKIYTRDDAHNIILVGGIYDGSGLPTSDPLIADAFWNDNGVLKVSAG